ncbi:MarR family winged helix-turn-helix transcriptional regulator [Streptosporangium sp. DT93]|uniref:MarR family winged helix-turn-helix transcriptional regulator n=1 Tax=Streptosporangium sp. DT93 TaxID=3393428 RepID=UPI003CFBA2DE
MPPPFTPPIGLRLTGVSKTVGRAFDEALAEAGGSLPTWLILISLKTRRLGNQRELAEAVGIQGATLTHHLNAMESAGLLTRRRDPANRRAHVVEFTDEGEALFHRLREAAVSFDRRLRADLDGDDTAAFERVLATMERNVGQGTGPAAVRETGHGAGHGTGQEARHEAGNGTGHEAGNGTGHGRPSARSE